MGVESIVTEMLNPDARVQTVSDYGHWLQGNGWQPSNKHMLLVEKAVKRPIYGIAVASNLQYFSQIDKPPTSPQIVSAVETLVQLTQLSEQHYAWDLNGTRPRGWYDSKDFAAEITSLHEAVARGEVNPGIITQPMTAAEGIKQVTAANEKLSHRLSITNNVQQSLADANYGTTFNSRTMLSAAEFPDTSPDAVADMHNNDRMSWLTKTNVASALVLAAVARQFSANTQGKMNVYDMGSGTGATMAAIVSSLAVKPGTVDLSRLNLTGIESNPQFFRFLTDFMPKAVERLEAAHGSEQTADVKFEQTDVTGYLREIPVTDDPHDLTVIVENYVAHRLTAPAKDAIIRRLGQAANGLFLFGDLTANSSYINRHYFDFTNNGPLNTGNRHLLANLASRGFTILKTHPSIPDSLAGAIQAERNNDCIAGIAYRGEYIGQLLAAAA